MPSFEALRPKLASSVRATAGVSETLIEQVYRHWYTRRSALLNKGYTLMPQIRTEKSATAQDDPYIAFRRRTERMQTRCNRQNDEMAYTRMLMLRSDFHRARDLMRMLLERETMKVCFLLTATVASGPRGFAACDVHRRMRVDDRYAMRMRARVSPPRRGRSGFGRRGVTVSNARGTAARTHCGSTTYQRAPLQVEGVQPHHAGPGMGCR